MKIELKFYQLMQYIKYPIESYLQIDYFCNSIKFSRRKNHGKTSDLIYRTMG
jgi:hypothetical protein